MNSWILIKKAKPYSGKKHLVTNGAGLSGCLYVKELKQLHIYHPVKLKSKWTKELNLKLDTLNLIEQNAETVPNSLV